MATPLPASCFFALATIVAADGVIRGGELAGLRRAALAYGVSPEDLARLEEGAQTGATLATIEFPELSRWQRALTYAFAVWLAKVDGTVSSDELSSLRELGERLELDAVRREAARSATYDIAALPGGHKPEQYDFEALEERLKEKLPASFREHVDT